MVLSSQHILSQQPQGIPVVDDVFICGTEEDLTPDPPGVYSGSLDPNYFNSVEPIVFNIFFWRINKSDGSYTDTSGIWAEPLSPERAQRGVDSLNYAYGQFNICFKLIGMDTINSTAIHTGANLSVIKNYADANGKVKENAFNVYVPRTLANNAAGIGSYNNTHCAVKDAHVFDNVIVHEIGHNFNLSHTHTGWRSNNCERVTRDINDPDYNASPTPLNNYTARGDKIHDTAAVPDFSREQLYIIRDVLINEGGFSFSDADNIAKNGFINHENYQYIVDILYDFGFNMLEIYEIAYNGYIRNRYIDPETCEYIGFGTDCDGTPYEIFETDVKNRMAYSYNPCEYLFTTGQGIRIHEAIQEDVYGKFELAKADYSIDLYIKNSPEDIGLEPDIGTEQFWKSEDIWIRNANDGGLTHQNPVYGGSSNYNYVKVRIQNKGCSTSTLDEKVSVYWAKANASLHWPEQWEDNYDDNGVLWGDKIYTETIPPLAPGEDIVITVPWEIPNPSDYDGNDNPWHFCLLARIESENDPMTTPETWYIPNNVKKNNNIAWKNITIIEAGTSSTISTKPGGVVAVSNFFTESKTYNLNFFTSDIAKDGAVWNEAEVRVTLDDTTWQKWTQGGRQKSSNISVFRESNKELLISGNHAQLANLNFAAGEQTTIYVSFNFLIKEVTDRETFQYHVTQELATDNTLIGGETYVVKRNISRPSFVAEGNSEEQDGNLEFTASTINENAVYNWYAPDGTLLHTGESFVLSSGFAGEYKLEVIAENDAHKDYASIQLDPLPNANQILSLNPNPAITTVTINYQINQANSAYLQVVKLVGNTSDNYILDVNETTTILDVSNYTTGIYIVVLAVDGQPVDAKQLVIE